MHVHDRTRRLCNRICPPSACAACGRGIRCASSLTRARLYLNPSLIRDSYHTRAPLHARGDENAMATTAAQKKSIRRRTVAYASALPDTTIKAYVWIPDQDPIAIVQIAHGMAEYAQRYDDFARFLACNGFLVCANDHIGHGGSCPSERWGNSSRERRRDHDRRHADAPPEDETGQR